MKKVLITGAAGFIGRSLAHLFMQKGYSVLGWDHNDSTEEFRIKKVDLINREEIKNGFKEFIPDILFHCAGNADVVKSVKNPETDFEGNVVLTHNILFVMHELNLKNVRFVFLSSAGVYGNPISLPIKENMALNPLSPYALHKVVCEELCRYFINNYNMDIKIARIFSAYGKGLKRQIFWDMYKKSCETGILVMFGTGNESRDYIHISDVINALFLIATTESDDWIYNVANGEEVTICEVAIQFAKAAGIGESNVKFTGIIREGDPINWKADISRIQSLGYKKTVKFDKGIEDYYEWIKNQ